MNVSDTEFDEMIEAGRLAIACVRAGLGYAEKFTAMRAGNARIRVNREIAHVRFVEDCICVVVQRNETIGGPAFWVNPCGVIDQSASGIGGGATGIGIVHVELAGLAGAERLGDVVEVILSVQISIHDSRPKAASVASHVNGSGSAVRGVIKESDSNIERSRGPEFE